MAKCTSFGRLKRNQSTLPLVGVLELRAQYRAQEGLLALSA